MKRSLMLIGLAACGSGGVDYQPSIDPARFVARVDNPFFPLVPGTVMEYAVTGTDETVTVSVTSQTKVVMGVTCVVVHDVAKEGGVVIEDTYDWYAQDVDGTVWYFGEDTTAYEAGTTSKEGSWEGGVDGAQPGIVMLGTPEVGQAYRQEYYEGEAEDEGQVIELDVAVTVPYGSFTGCVKTRDWTALEPGIEENKIYCRNVGTVRSGPASGGTHNEDLVSVTKPAS